MDAQQKDLLCILSMPSAKGAPSASSPLATSAKGLANGTTMSRKQALKLMGAGAATASFALAGCGGKDRANGSDSRSVTSTSQTTVAKGGSTPKQGPDAEKVTAAAKRAMEKYHLKAVLDDVGGKNRGRARPRPMPTGFRAFHGPDFPPPQIRLCVAGFMTRFVAEHLFGLFVTYQTGSKSSSQGECEVVKAVYVELTEVNLHSIRHVSSIAQIERGPRDNRPPEPWS